MVGSDNCVNPEAEGHSGLAEQRGCRKEHDSMAYASSGELQQSFFYVALLSCRFILTGFL